MSGTCLVALLPAGGRIDQRGGVVGGRASDRLIGALWFLISSLIFAVFSVVIRYDTTKVLSDESARDNAENPENPQAGRRVCMIVDDDHVRGGNVTTVVGDLHF